MREVSAELQIPRAWRTSASRFVRLAASGTLDASSPTARARERYRRVALTAISAGAARATSLLALLVTVPLALHALGRTEYGIFVTVTSVSAFVSLLDFGVGNALVTVVSRARGSNDLEAAREAFATAVCLMAALALALGVVLVGLFGVIPWAAVFNAPASQEHQIALAAAALAAGILASLPVNVLQRLQVASQDGYWMNGGVVLGAVLTVGGTAAAAETRASLLFFVLVVSLAPIAGALTTGTIYLRRHRSLMPRLSHVRIRRARSLVGVGWAFLVLQIAVVVAYQSDAIVLAHVRGPAAVASYAVPMRLFTLVPMLFTLIVAPLWPAYGEALERGDHAWVRSAFRRSLAFAVTVAVPVSLLAGLAAGPIVQRWAGADLRPSPLLLAALVGWAIAMTMTVPVSSFLNGTGVLRAQACAATVMMIANLGFSIVLAERLGVSGVVWGTVIAQVVFVGIPSAVLVRRRLRTLEVQVA